MRRSLLPAVAGLVLVAGCGGDATDPAACADPATTLAFPSPAWFADGRVAAPAGDRAAALLDEERAGWVEQLSELDGWSRLPDLVVPLSAVPGAVDASAVRLLERAGSGWEPRAVDFDVVVLEGEAALRLRPRLPLGAEADEVIVALGTEAVTGAEPLPVCRGGSPHPAYAEAMAAAGGGVAWAMRLPLASTRDALVSLGAALADKPVLEVAKIEARTLDSFGDKAPPAEVAALLAPTAASGLLELPDYRGASGHFTIGGDGVPVAQGITKPGFIVALPATGSAPYPFVLFQHGGGQDKADFFALAGPLAAAGFAFVAIDLPEHGDRGEPGADDLDFLDFDDGLATRDNFRQAVADHTAVLTGVEALDAALAPVLGVEQALDPERSFYMGLSLGGITGSMTFAVAPKLQGAALFVAGSSFADIVSYGVFSVLFNDVLSREPGEVATVLAALQTLLDGADPAAYADERGREGEPPRPALFMQAIGDTIVVERANDRLARVFGAAVAKPTHHPVDGVQELPLPAADNFQRPGAADKATRVLVHNPMAEVPAMARHGGLIVQPYSQEMVAHCFAGIVAEGRCEIVDTGFAKH